jgi:hypothetical protein
LRKLPLAVIPTMLALVVSAALPAYAAGDTLVTVGSPPSPFAQNKQNEPGLAVDAGNPNVLAAGSNDEIDLEACNAGNPTTCPFTAGVGLSGIYFSFNSGASWTQPTYTGWTARDCLGPAACTAHKGPIGTLPNYLEAGLVSGGDPSLAFGPRQGSNGKFAWSNGSRLYYANLASNFSTIRSEEAFKGFEAVTVSRADNLAAAAAGDATAWSAPVIVSMQNTALFSDKENVWADNAASSNFFGNVYVCNASFRAATSSSTKAEPEPIVFSRSTDGGVTWSSPMALSSATNNIVTGGRQFCTIRSDSHGVVYVYWDGFAGATGQPVFFQARSFDGGVSFERPRIVVTNTNCGLFDPNTGRLSMDGVGGARTSTEPSVDIANGAPTGSGATNEIFMAWCDGKTPSDTSPGPNEQAKIAYSVNGGASFITAGNAAPASDRPDFPAIAVSPNGKDVYLTYDAFLQPWQSTTANPRPMQGVVRHATVASTGAPGAWSDKNRAAIGDSRGSSQNGLTAGFLGDYNYAAATNSNGFAVWNDVRNAADCPAIDAFREAIATGATATRPAPNTDCPPTFGNTDIFGGAFTP